MPARDRLTSATETARVLFFCFVHRQRLVFLLIQIRRLEKFVFVEHGE